MFGSLKLFFAILQIGGYIFVNNANPVTNFNSGDTFVFELPKPKSQDAQSLLSRVSSLSAAGRSYGDTSAQSQATNPSSSANGRILSQPSTSDKDSITYPDDVIRDSYGNVVTPYSTLVEDAVSFHPSSTKPLNVGPGPLTDVSKDSLQFAIPSYSDGITELQGPYKPSFANAGIAPPLQTLLPPLSSGNYNYPSLDNHKISTDNSYQNEIGGSFSASAQSINPVPTGPTAITTNGHIGSGSNSPSIYTPNLQVPFSSPPAVANQPIHPTSNHPQSQSQPISGSSYSSNPYNPLANGVAQGSSDFSAIHVSSPASPSASFPFSNTKPVKDTQFVNQVPINIQVDSGKYTGGFGGAPGILGDQKVPGYAVKPSVNKPTFSASVPQVVNDATGSNSVHANAPLNSPSYGPQNGLSVKPNTNHGSFQFGTAFSPNPTPNSQISDNGKYTGGFGGPPGIYSPFDDVYPGKNKATSNTDPKRKY